MAEEKLGGLAKRWLRNQAKQLIEGDRRTRDRLEIEENRLEHRMEERAKEEAVYTAVPGLRAWKERQEAQAAADAAEREQRRRDELAARPRAGVALRISGEGLDGSWSGQLPALVEERPDTVYDEETGEDRVVGRTLVVDLTPLDEEVPIVAGLPLVGWTFAVPCFDGPGLYELGAITAAVEAEGGYVDATDWCLALGGWDEPMYWTADTGPGSVEVGPDGKALVVRLAVEAAWGGPFEVVASVNLP